MFYYVHLCCRATVYIQLCSSLIEIVVYTIYNIPDDESKIPLSFIRGPFGLRAVGDVDVEGTLHTNYGEIPDCCSLIKI